MLRHRRVFILLHLLVVLAVLPGVIQLNKDNSPEIFFSSDAAALAKYRQLQQAFGDTRALRIAVDGPGLWTSRGLSWLENLERQAAALEGVDSVLGPAVRRSWLPLGWPPKNPRAFRQKIARDSLEQKAGWVGADADTLTLGVILKSRSGLPADDVLEKLRALSASAPAKIQTRISGLPVLEQAMNRTLMRIVSIILPLLVLLSTLFLYLIFGRLRDVVVPLVFVGSCQVILFGLMGYLGATLNLVNIILPLLIFVIALATAVHLLVRFREIEQQGSAQLDAVLATYRSKGWAVTWTGLTTLAAFGSLVTADLPPVKSLGTWSAPGIVIMTVLAFTFFPLLLATGSQAKPPTPRPFDAWARRHGRNWVRWAVSRRTAIIAAALLITTAVVPGLLWLRVEDNLARYFSAAHPVRAELENLQAKGIGAYPADLVVSYRPMGAGTAPNTGNFLTPDSLQKLSRLAGLIRQEPQVFGAVGAGDMIDEALDIMLVKGRVSENTRWMILGMMQTAAETRNLLHGMVTADGQSARITLNLPMLSFNRLQPLFKRVEDLAKEIFPGTRAWVSGQFPLILQAQQVLIGDLFTSLCLTLMCVVLVFGLVLRSLKLTFLVLLPNLFPIVWVMGGMSLLGLPIDSATMITVSIVLGLAVDDTFHTLVHYLDAVRRQPPAAAIETTLGHTAPAHILTTIILAGGFLACYFTDFLPVSRMGGLSALAIAFALIGDLFLIPALLGRK